MASEAANFYSATTSLSSTAPTEEIGGKECKCPGPYSNGNSSILLVRHLLVDVTL
jgi:hypothetical protein